MITYKTTTKIRRSIRYAGVPVISRAFLMWIFAWLKSIRYRYRRYSSMHQLIESHFTTWSVQDHSSRKGLEMALASCGDIRLIVETGTSAWGCDSTRLLDRVARMKSAKLFSVDIRPEASHWLKHQLSKQTKLFVQDSIEFFTTTLPRQCPNAIDFAYLDSFDLDYRNPEPSELHCWEEFQYVCRFARIGAIVLIDDTPANFIEVPKEFQSDAKAYFEKNNRLPGKGSLVLHKVKGNEGIEILKHANNLILRILKSDPLRS